MIGWAIYFLSASMILVTMLFYYLYRYRNYIGISISKKMAFGALFPFVFLHSLWYLIESIYILSNSTSLAPIWLVTLSSSIVLGFVFALKVVLNSTYRIKSNISEKYRNNPFFGPYIAYGNDPSNSMIISWGISNEFREKHSSEIQEFLYGSSIEHLKGASSKIQTKKVVQTIKLQNLQENTRYYYKIPTKSEIFNFKTAPKYASAATASFDFIAISDSHANEADLQPLIEVIQKFAPNSKFILSSGDNISIANKVNNWRTFFGQMHSLFPNLPFHTCTGNHDAELRKYAPIWKEMLPYFYDNPEEGFYYSFNYLNCAFFFLDLYNAGKKHRIPKKEQIEWLESHLENLPSHIQHRILLLHNSIYSTGEFGCDPDLEEIFLPIIEKHHIQLVLSGHTHVFEAFHRTDINSPEGTLFIVNGGGGGKLDELVLGNRNYPSTPYKWDNRIHIAKKDPYLRGNIKNRFRNDKIVLNFQEIGKLTHEFLKISIRGNELKVQAIECDGNILYEKKVLGSIIN
ncbi:3',5'-cyclic adenosine monophosphate phosphodiesterase CpdA [Candidatus Lokiarchaeum ossiferum]